MPLVFPPKPKAVFNRGLRHFPLDPESGKKSAVPVEPLTRPQAPGQARKPAQMRANTQAPPRPYVPPHKIAPLQHLLHANSPRPMPPQAPPRPQMPLPSPPMIPNAPLPQNAASPQNAAEQFRRVNQSLPDGVHYEPLDEETMKILRQRAGGGDKQAQAPVSAPAPGQPQVEKPQPEKSQAFGTYTPMIPMQAPQQVPPQSKSLPGEAAEILEGLAQNEHKTYVFYSHFAASKDTFAVLAKASKLRIEQYNALLSQFFKKTFVPQESVINKEISLAEAVALAISEESKGLTALANLSELLADTEAEKQIWRVINKKVIGQQLLMAIKL